ncbi:MAG: M23 family metallopeptidase [Acidobacteriota bacterium]
MKKIGVIDWRQMVWLPLTILFCCPLAIFADQVAQRPRTTRAPGAPVAPAARLLVAWEPLSLVNGAPFMLRVRASEPLRSLTATWMGKEVSFELDEGSRDWIGLSGVALEVTPGRYPLVLDGETLRGVRSLQNETLTVKRASYRSSALSVAREFTEPDPQTAARIAAEQVLKKALFSRLISPRRIWAGVFVAPIKSVITEPFGTQRTFNGQVQSVHQGLDFRAGPGTPIQAMNTGTVVLARELFFEGNCVVVDHGQGLLTLYLHLSQIDVKEGDRVQKSQTIGLSGATGRVTAPHLHVAVRWNGIYLDPARLLKLPLPE